MMAPRQFDGARGRTRRQQEICARGAMSGSACHGPPNLEPRCGIRQAPGHAKVAGNHPRDPIPAALVALPNIVDESRGEEIAFRVFPGDEPARCVRAVQDVTCVLRGEEVEQGIAEPFPGERVVRVRGEARGMTKLADTLADHSTRSKTSSCTARMIQVIGLRPTKLRRKRTMSGANPTRASMSRSWVETGSGASPQTIL